MRAQARPPRGDGQEVLAPEKRALAPQAVVPSALGLRGSVTLQCQDEFVERRLLEVWLCC